MKIKGIKLCSIVLLVAIIILSQGCTQSQDVDDEQDMDLDQGAEDVVSEEEVNIEVEVTGDGLAIRKTPGTSDKPEGDVIQRVNSGHVLEVISKHDNAVIHDGYTWWEVYNPSSNVAGWSASRYLSELTER